MNTPQIIYLHGFCSSPASAKSRLLGDYMAGSNHVLPTGGCAHYASGLGVHSFVRAVQVIEYSAEALEVVADRIVTLANAENLPAHGEAVQARF